MSADYQFCPLGAQPLTSRSDGGRRRATCPSGHWTHWDNPLPVLAALVEIEGRILLARNAAWPEKMLGLITGFMERGETPEQGIARELKEETNLDAQGIRLIGVYDYIPKNEVIVAFHVTASGAIRLSDELAEYRLIAPEKLRPWRMGTGLAVADWMRMRGLPFEFLEPLPLPSPPANG